MWVRVMKCGFDTERKARPDEVPRWHWRRGPSQCHPHGYASSINHHFKDCPWKIGCVRISSGSCSRTSLHPLTQTFALFRISIVFVKGPCMKFDPNHQDTIFFSFLRACRRFKKHSFPNLSTRLPSVSYRNTNKKRHTIKTSVLRILRTLVGITYIF